MTAARRWCLVGLGVLLLAATPVLARAVPANDSDVRAGSLLAAIRASDQVPYSGYAESSGTVQLPVAGEFESIVKLFGERTRMRVWWRGSDDWHVAKLRTTGESGLFHDARGTTRWEYESARATRTVNRPVRLPNASDLVPPVLARYVLAGATDDEVSRLPAERIAGRSAPGLRLVPSDAQSTIGHVDVWADPDSGLPLRVRMYEAGRDAPAVSTGFDDLTLGRPPASTTTFDPPPGTDLRFDDTVDVAAAADRFAPYLAPDRLAGLTRRDELLGAVGIYGRGPTVLLAIPLWHRVADPLREQLRSTPGVQDLPDGTGVQAGPLHLLLSRPDSNDTSWLLLGTVTDQTLRGAMPQLSGRQVDVR